MKANRYTYMFKTVNRSCSETIAIDVGAPTETFQWCRC